MLSFLLKGVSDMDVFDPRQFAVLLKKAIGTRSAKEFSKEVGISRYQVSRRLNGTLLSPPRKSTLFAIASAAQNNVTYEELLACCGYLDIPDGKTLPETDMQDIKKARACVLANMDCLKATCQIPVGEPQIPCDFELLVGEAPCVHWDFICIPSSESPAVIEGTLNQHYLDLIYERLEAYSKLSFLTNRRVLFDACTAHRPVNLDANVSVILYDSDLLEVISENELSKSKTSPLPDGSCCFHSEDG